MSIRKIVAAAFALCAASIRGQTSADLDGISKRLIAQEHVVGASVLVAQGDRIIFQKGYGFADLGLEAPTKAETVYGVVGPMMPFTGIAITQRLMPACRPVSRSARSPICLASLARSSKYRRTKSA